MLTQQQEARLNRKNLLIGQKWTRRYLDGKLLPSKAQIECEMISLALINQSLTEELKRVREQLVESEEARLCAFLTVTFLEKRSKTERHPNPGTPVKEEIYRKCG